MLRRRPVPRVLLPGSDGLSILEGTRIVESYPWGDVQSIVAYVVDEVTVDTVVVDFAMRGGVTVTIDEDALGFDELMGFCVERFQIDPGWKGIALPPFSTERRTLFKR